LPIAILVRFDLARAKLEDLRDIAHAQRAHLAGQTHGSLVVRSRADNGSEARCRAVHELDTARTHDRVVGSAEPTPEEAGARLRRAGASLAKLVGRPIYVHLRTRDRHQIRRFQQRIADYLGGLGGVTPASRVTDLEMRDGLRLYRDLANLTELMMQVNNRVELRGHDATVAQSVADELRAGLALDAAGNPVGSMDPTVAAAVRAIVRDYPFLLGGAT